MTLSKNITYSHLVGRETRLQVKDIEGENVKFVIMLERMNIELRKKRLYII